MRIYSNTLTPADLHRASMGLPLYCWEVAPLARPKLRKQGWRVKVLGYSRRQTNSGNHGASGESSASWDDHGRWFARIFDLDPMALVVASARYDGRAEFHVKTGNKYHPIWDFYENKAQVEKGD